MLVSKSKQRTRNNLKKFRNAKFNYAKFVKDYYIEDGEAYISLKVKSINDIVSRYSIDGYEWINLKFANIIEEHAYYIPVEESITLEICGTKFDDNEKKIILKVIKDYFGLQLGDKIIDIDINKKKSAFLITSGILFFISFMALSKFKLIAAFNELILLGVWFFGWEYADLALIQRSVLKTEKIEAGQLATMKIKFVEECE